MNNKLKNKFTITLAFIAIIGLAACSDKKEKDEIAQTVQQENALDTPTVAIVPVTKGKLTSNITVPGELQPYLTVDLYAKINSYVKTLSVDIGSQVHKGQVLASLEAPEINSQLEEAKSHIQQFKAQYFASKATYNRLLSTSKTPGTVSQNDLEQADARAKSDSANVEASKSAYRVVADNLAYLEIRAPFDGVVTVRNVNQGTYVGPSGSAGNQPLFVVEDHTRLRLVISVPENFTGGLSNKSVVTFTVKALQGEKFTAQVKRLSGALDEKLRSERLEMDVYNKGNKLLPNMYADVNVPLPARDSAFIVPKTAVVTSTEKVFVIIVRDNHAQWVDVQRGVEAGDSMEVYGKLQTGDELVKVATEEIRNGAPIKRGPAAKASGDTGEGKEVSGPSGNQKPASKKDSSAKK